MTTATLETAIRCIQNQGSDPVRFRTGLAATYKITAEEVDLAIAAVGDTAREVDAETVAQERLAEDRRAARQNSAAYRAYGHEEV